MTIKNLILPVSLCLLFSVVFFIFPQIDINTTALFFDDGKFFSPDWMLTARYILDWVVWLLILVLFFLLVVGLMRRKKQVIRTTLFIILCFALGPGLLVNVVLKNHWGRPRPGAIVQFGGTATYQKPWVISNQCATNCSFVAGDSSSAFAFFALVVLIRKKTWRRLAASFCLVGWLFFAFMRIAAGGHFLSDVLIGATLVWVVIVLVSLSLRGKV